MDMTSAKFKFDCSKPFKCNVKFKTFDLDSLKSHFNQNQFKFKKMVLYADFEKEDVKYFMDEAKKKQTIKQKFASFSKYLRLTKIYKKIKRANQGFKYEGKKKTISFSYGGRHNKKFIPLPKTVTLWATVDFSRGYQLNIGTLRPMSSKDLSKKKETKLVFKCPELSKAILKAMKYKALGKEID